jgi:hypothetical protein
MQTQNTILDAPAAMPVGEVFFEEAMYFTRISEYGVSIQALTSGQIEPPPGGARFEVAYGGTIQGERLNGTIEGVDYIEVRADGRFLLNIHATITTHDGVRIALTSDGILTRPDAEAISQVRLNMRLSTAVPAYTWVNQLHVWGTGTVNMDSGQISVRTYIA